MRMICNINLNMTATRNGSKRLTPLVYQRARELVDSYGDSAEEVAAQYHLALSHVYAGIAYYLANKNAIDADLEEERGAYDAAFAEHLAKEARASA